MPQLYMIIPVGGLDSGARPDQGLPGHQPYPDQGLPGGQGGRPSQPIYHPGHPDHGYLPYPDQGLPGGGSGIAGHPSHPIHIPGVPDQGLPEGQPIPDNELPPPTVPPEYNDDLIIGVKPAGSSEWTFTAYDVQPDQGQPAPEPHSRSRRSR